MNWIVLHRSKQISAKYPWQHKISWKCVKIVNSFFCDKRSMNANKQLLIRQVRWLVKTDVQWNYLRLLIKRMWVRESVVWWKMESIDWRVNSCQLSRSRVFLGKTVSYVTRFFFLCFKKLVLTLTSARQIKLFNLFRIQSTVQSSTIQSEVKIRKCCKYFDSSHLRNENDIEINESTASSSMDQINLTF